MNTYPETIQDVKCHRCNLAFNDIVVVWYDDEGCFECPECGLNGWLNEKPDPDPIDEEEDRYHDYLRRHLR